MLVRNLFSYFYQYFCLDTFLSIKTGILYFCASPLPSLPCPLECTFVLMYTLSLHTKKDVPIADIRIDFFHCTVLYKNRYFACFTCCHIMSF